MLLRLLQVFLGDLLQPRLSLSIVGIQLEHLSVRRFSVFCCRGGQLPLGSLPVPFRLLQQCFYLLLASGWLFRLPLLLNRNLGAHRLLQGQ